MRLRLLIRLFTFGSVAWMAYAALLFATLPPTPSQARPAYMPLSLGVVCLGIALILAWWQARPNHHIKSPLQTPQSRPIKRFWLMCGITLLALATQSNLVIPPQPVIVSHEIQAALFIGGLLLSGFGLSGGITTKPRRMMPRFKSHHLGLIALLALAVVLRGWQLEQSIHRMVDEVHFVSAAGRLIHAPYQALFTQHGAIAAFAWLYPYAQVWTTHLFGASLLALRMVSLILGVIQVMTVYALVKVLWDRPTAWVAAALLATYPLHLHFSRLALNNIADPTFGLLAMLCVVYGLRFGKQGAWAWGGIFLGLTHYFYEGGRLFYTAFVVLWLIWLWLFGRRSLWRVTHVRHLLIFVIAFVLIVTPLYYVWFFWDLKLIPRYDSVGGDLNGFLWHFQHSLDPLTTLWVRIEPLWLSYVHLPVSDTFYKSDAPYVLPWLVPWFLLGMAHSLWRGRSAGGALLWWWVIAVAVANSIIGTVAFSPRYAVVYPALMMVVALGLTQTVLMLITSAPWRKRLILIVLMLAMGYQTRHYFADFLPDYYERVFYNELGENRTVFVKDFDDLLFRAVKLPPDTHVYIISPALRGSAGYDAVLLYWGRNDDLKLNYLDSTTLNADDLQRLDRRVPLAFFVEPFDEASISLLANFFDLGEAEFSPHNIPRERQFALYTVMPIAP